MIAYSIHYRIKNDKKQFDYSRGIDAKNIQSAKQKIERLEKRKIIITSVSIVGYY